MNITMSGNGGRGWRILYRIPGSRILGIICASLPAELDGDAVRQYFIEVVKGCGDGRELLHVHPAGDLPHKLEVLS